ncbi:c3.3 [Tranosema rostrale ichnovirus]|nr:c3.3 [Tranosema rostrale ichnovirus]
MNSGYKRHCSAMRSLKNCLDLARESNHTDNPISTTKRAPNNNGESGHVRNCFRSVAVTLPCSAHVHRSRRRSDSANTYSDGYAQRRNRIGPICPRIRVSSDRRSLRIWVLGCLSLKECALRRLFPDQSYILSSIFSR